MDKSKIPTDLNVPKRLISACKNDKVRCELLALSVRIKIEFGDSLMKNVSPYSIQKILHCGYNKAKLLLLLAKTEYDLFYYNPYTNSLLAKNFKKKYTLVDNWRNKKRWSMYAIKFERKDYSLKELIFMLKESLFLCAINAKERRDEFRCKNNNTSFTSESPLTQKNIQAITGLKNRMAVYRMTKRMENSNKITSERAKIDFKTNCISADSLKECCLSHTYLIISRDNNAAYAITPKTYKIKNYAINKRFCNIIFNHKKRYHVYGKSEHVENEEHTKISSYYERNEH